MANSVEVVDEGCTSHANQHLFISEAIRISPVRSALVRDSVSVRVEIGAWRMVHGPARRLVWLLCVLIYYS